MSLISGLVKDYGDFKLNIPKWELPDQGVSALVGPSGSGKTTCFRLLLGLEDCQGLAWEFRGEDLCKVLVPERRLGVVFQTYDLFPHMTTEQNILFAARSRGVKEAEKKLIELCDQLQIVSLQKKPVTQLSGGEQQRVALARALIGEPRFLFLDEPFSALDTDLKNDARKLVRRVIDEHNIPTLLITHDQDDVKYLASSVFQIHSGQLR